MLTLLLVLAILALICTVASAANKCPGWVPVMLLSVIACLQYLPLR